MFQGQEAKGMDERGLECDKHSYVPRNPGQAGVRYTGGTQRADRHEEVSCQ